mmetsp:Transcript_25495/g.58823  ORF Transcript_25495/g.58823 Transcript_25495/m.58823 type:complete len:218 (-) Transcript_25495:773-1426(-)
MPTLGLKCIAVRTCVPLHPFPLDKWYADMHWNAIMLLVASNMSAMRCSVDTVAMTYVSFSNSCPAACHSKSSRSFHLCHRVFGNRKASWTPRAPACMPVMFTLDTKEFQEGSFSFATSTLNTSTGVASAMQKSVCHAGRASRGTPSPPHNPSRRHISKTAPLGKVAEECSSPRGPPNSVSANSNTDLRTWSPGSGFSHVAGSSIQSGTDVFVSFQAS